MNLTALRELAAKVEANDGKAHYPTDEFDRDAVLRQLNDAVTGILRALIAQEEGK